jgi:hypothetical protein
MGVYFVFVAITLLPLFAVAWLDVISMTDAEKLVDSWNRNFAKTNMWTQLFSLAIGCAVAYANYEIYSRPEVGFWTIKDENFSVTGWVYLCCIALFYCIVSMFVLRTVTISRFLRDLVNNAQIVPVPFHPDHCGGLRPVGMLGLRTQYLLSVVGMNLLVLIFIYYKWLIVPPELNILILLAVVGYFVLGPTVFLFPLLPFRDAMMDKKSELMNDVAHRLSQKLDRIRSKIRKGRTRTQRRRGDYRKGPKHWRAAGPTTCLAFRLSNT